MENETKEKFVYYLLENEKKCYSLSEILEILTESHSTTIEKCDYVNKSRHAFDLEPVVIVSRERTNIHI